MKKIIVLVAVLSLMCVTPSFAFMDSTTTLGNGGNNHVVSGDGNNGVNGDVNGGFHGDGDVCIGECNTGDTNVNNGGQGGAGGDGGDANVEIGDVTADGGDAEANSESNSESSSSSSVTINEAENKRDLTNAPIINAVPNTPAFNETATPTGNVQKMQNILIFKAEFTYAQLKALKGTSTHPWSERAKVRAKYYGAEKHTRVADDAKILAVLAVVDKEGNVTKPAGDYAPAVHITVEGKSSTTTVSAFARSAIAALKGGCNMIIITGEGAKRIMEAGGFGAMLGTSVMTISDGGKNATGTASVGGLGFSKTWAGYGYCPWLQSVGAIR